MRGERERRRHALLGGDELDIGAQPAAQRLDRRRFALQLLGELAELLDLAAIDRLVTAPRASGNGDRACRCRRRRVARHRLQARVRAAGAEHGLRRLQHALAVAQRIGARLSRGLCGPICHRCRSRITHSLQRSPPLENGGCLRIICIEPRRMQSRQPERGSPSVTRRCAPSMIARSGRRCAAAIHSTIASIGALA